MLLLVVVSCLLVTEVGGGKERLRAVVSCQKVAEFRGGGERAVASDRGLP